MQPGLSVDMWESAEEQREAWICVDIASSGLEKN